MRCTYTLFGKTFNSELELDSFLMDRLIMYEELGDIVFSINAEQAHVQKILNKINKDAKKLVDLYNEGNIHYGEDGKEIEIVDSRYVGVNKLLRVLNQKLERNGDRIMIPIFYDLKYWENTFKRWENGNFTDDEKEFLPTIDNSITDKDHMPQVKTTDTILINGHTLKKHDYYKVEIIKKWKNLAYTGDIIHKIMELLFTRTSEAENTYYKDSIFINDANGNLVINTAMIPDLKSKVILEFTKDKHKPMEIKDTRVINGVEETYFPFKELLDNTLGNDAILNSILLKALDFQTLLKKEFGEEALFYPEFGITTKIPKGIVGVENIYGIIDLLVIDKTGKVHIVDYKTSIHPYLKYSDAKKLGYVYLQGLYGRVLGKCGVDTSPMRYYIIPIELCDFKKTNSGYTYSGINLKGAGHDMFVNITDDINKEQINENLRGIINYPRKVHITADDLSDKVKALLKLWFPKYKGRYDEFTEEMVKEDLGDKGLEVDSDGNYTWSPRGYSGAEPKVSVKADHDGAEAEFLLAILDYRNGCIERNATMVEQVVHAFNSIKLENYDISAGDFPFLLFDGSSDCLDWFKLNMSKYCNPNWEVIDNVDWAKSMKERFGIITLWNETLNLYDFIKISSLGLTLSAYADASHTSLGSLNMKLSDVFFASNPNSMMMEATYGNIELMEIMLCLNTIAPNTDILVGNIMVADPRHGIGIAPASNYELLTCFNEIDSVCAIENGNKLKKGNIKFAERWKLASTALADIEEAAVLHLYKDDYRVFKDLAFRDPKSALDSAADGTVDDKIRALLNIMRLLENDKTILNELKAVTEEGERLAKPYRMLYNLCAVAIAELKNIHFKLLLRDHSKWAETLAIHRHGLSGSWIDNPGTLSSETLNLLTKMVTEAYLNVRVDMQNPADRMRILVNKLKEEKGFSALKERTIGNLADLFKDLYEEYEGDIYFKNPYDPSSGVSGVGKEILEYIIPEINSTRYNELEMADGRWKNESHSKFFRIPLCIGDSSSTASKDGLLKTLKDRLSLWNPKTAVERALVTMEGIFDDKAEKLGRKDAGTELFKMNNIFSRTNSDAKYRKFFISKYPVELNFETMFLKHTFAYASLKRIDEVFPNIKAAMIHLTMLGLLTNLKGGFKNDLDYAEKYIKDKIKHESLIAPEYRKLKQMSSKLQSLASKLALGFSPVSGLYLLILGLWNDIALIVRNPDGRDTFTFANMWDAAKIVYKDMIHFSEDPTVVGNLNRLYGINDMDMNTYVDKIKSDQHGIHHFTLFLFKFASRPDYYNRMTIFVAKMLADGSYYAHSVDKHGRMEYDWTLDERYKAFANGNVNDPDYYKARARYIAAAKLFESENTNNLVSYIEKTGEEKFRLNLVNPMPLPRAYTNLEAESMKALSDTIYGYYSHEKKSMIHSELWGAMFMLFRTFWSGKKNQYLAAGGIKLEGHWEQYTEKDDLGNTIEYFYLEDDKGNVLYDLPPVAEDDPTASKTPVMQWKGDWKEGITTTVFNLLKAGYDNGPEGIKQYWYSMDESVRNACRSNLTQLAFDVAMFAVVGNVLAAGMGAWYDDEKSEADKSDYGDALKLTAINIMAKSLNNSFLDFNFIKSIGEPGTSWTPFAISYLTKQVSNVYNTCMGEMNVFDTIARSNAFFTLLKPMFYTAKYNWLN